MRLGCKKDELIDFAIRSGAPMEVVENLQELVEDEPGMQWETIKIFGQTTYQKKIFLMKMNNNSIFFTPFSCLLLFELPLLCFN